MTGHTPWREIIHKRLEDRVEAEKVKADDDIIKIDGAGSVKIETPDGLIYVSVFPVIGTQVMVYTDRNHNPIGYISLRPKDLRTWRHKDGSVRVDHMDAREGDYFGDDRAPCPECGSPSGEFHDIGCSTLDNMPANTRVGREPDGR